MKKILCCLLLAALAALLILRLRPAEAPPVPAVIAAVVPDPHPALTEIFRQAGQDPALSGTALGFCLLDAEGAVIFEEHSTTAFIPASTLKTLTTATALEKWGPDFRIETNLRSTAPVKDGLITGDVVIQGGADPMLSLDDVQAWARQLKKQGVVRITGRFIGDGRILPGSLYDDFWNWGDIGNAYGSGVAGLNLEHNRFSASFRPGLEPGMKAEFLGATPEVPGIRWINEVTTGLAGSGDGVVIHGGEHTGTMHLRGTVPLGRDLFEAGGAVPDPELYAAWHLRAALIEADITVTGKALAATGLVVPETPELLLKHESPPLIEIITSIHATSDNHETECLYRLLGVKESRPSDEVVREHWKARGLVFQGLRMEDGCGLARADFIRPLDLASLQHFAGKGPHGSLYRASLLSTEDGGLQWKGGAMSGVRSTTGFVRGASGAEFTFALMVNHFGNSSPVSSLRERVLQVLRGL